VGHSVAVGAQGHEVRLEIHLSLVLREELDEVDLVKLLRIHRQFIFMCSYGESKVPKCTEEK
jgi:RNase P/RNase MRP subunit p30